jgi:hydrogenase expression/formation protein HypE
VREEVRGACELLGFDPLYLANEGRFIACLPASAAETALVCLAGVTRDTTPALIGRVTRTSPGQVIQRTGLGTRRIVDMLSGEQLPRIC